MFDKNYYYVKINNRSSYNAVRFKLHRYIYTLAVLSSLIIMYILLLLYSLVIVSELRIDSSCRLY